MPGVRKHKKCRSSSGFMDRAMESQSRGEDMDEDEDRLERDQEREEYRRRHKTSRPSYVN